MKFTAIALSLSLATAGHLAVAQPHRHAHRHAEKRSPGGPTVTVYELNGTPVPWDVVEKGLKDGSLTVINGSVAPKTDLPKETPAPSPAEKQEEEEKPAVTTAPDAPVETQPESYMPDEDKKDDHDEHKADEGDKEQKDDKDDKDHDGGKKGDSGKGPSGGQGVDRDFPDGELDCSTFPSEYGAVEVPWEGLEGWTGLQKLTYTSDAAAVADIETRKSGPCGDGMMCSYACPAGYQKSQWPEVQGATGQSVGGIECRDGKLHLPKGSRSKKLCEAGTGGVKAQNKVGKPIAVCRTDYPGTESMNIPATMDPSSSEPYELTCPNQDTYYRWQGKKTSAQYYVNPIDTPLEEACTWGSAGSNVGNWAPINLGVSETAEGKWLSIFQNAPTNSDGKVHFKIEIEVDGEPCKCKYEDGKYWQNGQPNNQGCTVGTKSNAVFVFS